MSAPGQNMLVKGFAAGQKLFAGGNLLLHVQSKKTVKCILSEAGAIDPEMPVSEDVREQIAVHVLQPAPSWMLLHAIVSDSSGQRWKLIHREAGTGPFVSFRAEKQI